ncbi:flagellar basal body-associated FliL family protein [Roseobacter sp.]|uniref:flagellar basal body-associated FliL family protein n=1 Tax=Roseobacter sp. TaxID=1907202 RepID=UPI00385C6E37
MKKLLPILMLFIGSGAGVGAGIFLRPAVEVVEQEVAVEDEEKDQNEATSKDETNEEEISSVGMEYVKLPNQFVVPLVDEDRISAMVVMALSIEVAVGYGEEVFDKEPKLRNEFLRILFDHASVGGFDGAFVNNENLDVLRRDLREVAQMVMGPDVANDVLIFEIARQDY